MEKSKELENCNFVRLILMLAVVIYHSMVFWKGGWFYKEPTESSNALKYIAMWLNTFHIYGFVLVSGYVFYALKFEKNKYKEYGKFLLNKIKRLLVPLCFTSLIWAIPFYIIYFKSTINLVIKKFGFMESPSQLWFLAMLFVVFSLYYPISNIVNKNWIIGGGIVLLLYCIGMVGNRFFPNIFQIWSGLKYIIFFWIGCNIRKEKDCFIYRIPTIIFLLFDLTIFVLWNYLNEMNLELLASVCHLVLCIVGSIGAFVIFQRLACLFNTTQSAIFKFGYKHTMTIYLFHQQFIYIVIDLLDDRVSPILLAIINFIVSIIGSCIISLIMNHFAVTRFLTSGKLFLSRTVKSENTAYH